jgi:hypothetical protein
MTPLVKMRPNKKRNFKPFGNSKKSHAGKYPKKKQTGPRSKAARTTEEDPKYFEWQSSVKTMPSSA